MEIDMDKYQYRLEIVRFDEKIAKARQEADASVAEVSVLQHRKARFELEVAEAWDKARIQSEAEQASTQ
jgi:hypothetical protein